MDPAAVAAVLEAYRRVADASWPGLHPTMTNRAPRWPEATSAELERELATYLAEAARAPRPIRVFWKLGAEFRFAGCNEAFARDAGFAAPRDLVGLDDFDARLPWVLQGAKYRADDEAVYRGGMAKLDIVERQKSSTGQITWVRAGKAAIRTARGETIGVLGMYEVLDSEVGRKLFAERNRMRGARGKG